MALPKGFRIGTANAQFRRAQRDDVAIMLSDVPCSVAGVFTTNAFKAAPVLECERILALENADIRAVMVNSGQANACTGDEGLANCKETLRLMAEVVQMHPDQILPMSTGVIGNQLIMNLWPEAVTMLGESLGTKDEEHFTKAMMTTDAFPKFCDREIQLSKGSIHLAGMTKGAGMICPNMATMLAVVACDAGVDKALWQKLFVDAVNVTFNRVTVDGDTSTNDTVLGFANGASGIVVTENDTDDVRILREALEEILGSLAYMLVQDGEGSSKVIRIEVEGAKNDADAEKVARTVGHSQLVKTAMYGRDANWGRIIAAVGRSGADFNPSEVRMSLCGVELFIAGQPTRGNHDAALEEPLRGRDVTINIGMGNGEGSYVLLASDLSHDYVTCNADYRT